MVYTWCLWGVCAISRVLLLDGGMAFSLLAWDFLGVVCIFFCKNVCFLGQNHYFCSV